MQFEPKEARVVFVIEDDEDIRLTLKTALEIEGYEVESAVNGKEAIAAYDKVKGRIGLILLDLMMPEMGGREFLKAIRAQGIFEGVPIVVLTAAGEKQKPEGATELVKKPIDLEMLYSIAKKYIH